MEFDAKTEVNNIAKFVQDYYQEHNLAGAVLGLSGGKDSAVVLALLVRALGKDNVVALTLPCHSISEDKSLAEMVAEHFGVKCVNVDLSETFDSLTHAIKSGCEVNDSNLNNSNINLKPRLRTATLYYYAAMMSSLKNKPYIVIGTSNKCELFVGYFTKGGDNVCDLSLISDFTVEEVIKLGEELGVPSKVLYRAPSDGISGISDEEKLGVTYREIASYIDNPESVSKESREKIEKLHSGSLHKFNLSAYRRNK